METKNGKPALRCLIRKKLIIETPEELVRQETIKKLKDVYNIPEDMIKVEMKINKYSDDIESKDRADIIVEHLTLKEDGELHIPIVVIECKQYKTPLTYKVIEQVEKYSHYINAQFYGITNGKDLDWYIYDENLNEYKQIENLPIYNDILNSKNIAYVDYKSFYSSNERKILIKETPDFPEKLIPFIENLGQLLHNENSKIPKIKHTDFEIISDNGLRKESNGNASGGSWEGMYRYFLIKLKDVKNHETIGFSLLDWSKSVIILAISYDDNYNAHHTLQLRINDWVKMREKHVELWHDGSITVGKLGKAKNEDIINFVKSKYPEIVVGEYVYLGSLDNSIQFDFTSKDIQDFFTNLIKYAICREEFRKFYKKK